MAYAIVHRDDLERTGNWALVRRSLGCNAFGVNLVEIPPGESIPEHDETARDQEELFFVVSGAPALVIDGEPHPPRRARSPAWTRRIAAPSATTGPRPPRCSSSQPRRRAATRRWSGRSHRHGHTETTSRRYA